MTAVGRTDAFAARALEVGIALGTGRPAVPGNSKVSPVPREGWTQSKAALGQRLRDSLPVFCCLCSRKGEGSGHHGADAIILRLKEVRPQTWEDSLGTLSGITVASNPDLGISPILESINTALKKYVPKEWGVEPHLKVSNLTREHLRKVITAFIATGDGDHAAPFYRQGTGTINMLVLAMLSQIAEDKQNVIFAMEEPETAIPPYAQKRIVHEVRKLASQTLFTSHSPYVLEEFAVEETVVLGRDADGVLARQAIALPANVKLKRYRQQFRTRFCEGLLARRILVAEGATEASAFPAACRRLAELKPDTYSSLEALGVCIVDSGGESDIPGMAQLYRELG